MQDAELVAVLRTRLTHHEHNDPEALHKLTVMLLNLAADAAIANSESPYRFEHDLTLTKDEYESL